MTVDMGDANIVYIASLCFDDSFMRVLGQRLETLPQLEYIGMPYLQCFLLLSSFWLRGHFSGRGHGARVLQ